MERPEQLVHISAGTIVKVIVIGLLFTLLFVLKDIVLVLLMSIVVASAIEPGALWFQKKGVARLFSVIIIYFLIASFLVGVVYFLVIPLLTETSDFMRNFPKYFNSNQILNSINNSPLFSSGSFASELKNSFNIEDYIAQINQIVGSISSNAFGTVATFFGGILSFFLIVILSFYLSVEEDGVGKFLKAITTIKHEKYVVALWKRSQKKIGLWMQGQLVLAVIIGMLVYLGLLLLKVPNALLLACFAAAFEIIPLFGPILASIPAIAISFVSGGFPTALIVAGLYLIVHQFENQLIYPLVVKKVVGVSPVVSIVALAAGWQLAGVIGLILAVPIASVVIEFISDLEKDKIEKIERMMNNN
ncbi:MAG: AI-2E family transporter [Minisyncoccia bacterium]